MSFMKPQIYEGGYLCLETSNGETHYFPDDIPHDADPADTVTEFQGYLYRLSAPGYLDCTEWAPADSLVEAAQGLLGDFGDQFDWEDLEELSSYLSRRVYPMKDNLFIRTLRRQGFSDEQIELILDTLEVVCQHCKDDYTPCNCWRDD